MAIELECKVRIPDRATLRERLRQIGATAHGDVHEKNTLFDFPDHALSQRETLLRLRTHGDLPGGVLTCKRPAESGQFKRREETETSVADHLAMREILTALGYAESWFYEKRRETWRAQGCEIVLDRVPMLGCFIEIEADHEQPIETLIRALQLDPAAHLTDSYIALWRQHCAAQEIDFCDMRFAP